MYNPVEGKKWADVTIGSWTGTGYISLDKTTGAGAYMISGSLNGGSHPVIATGLVTLGMVLNILSSQYLLSAISLITVPTLLKLAGIALFMQGIYYIHMLLIAYVDYLATNDMTYFNKMCDWLFKSAFWSVVQSYFATWVYYEEAYKAYEEEKEAANAEVESGSGTTPEVKPEKDLDSASTLVEGRIGEKVTLYRGDRSSVTPDIVFNNGFTPKGTHDDPLLHTMSNTTAGNFVSTTASKDIAIDFAGKNGYVYVIETDNYININETYGNMARYPEQVEFTIPGGINASEVVGAYELKGGNIVGDFIPNPNYGGSN